MYAKYSHKVWERFARTFEKSYFLLKSRSVNYLFMSLCLSYLTGAGLLIFIYNLTKSAALSNSTPPSLPIYLLTYLPTYLPTYPPTFPPTFLTSYLPTHLTSYPNNKPGQIAKHKLGGCQDAMRFRHN